MQVKRQPLPSRQEHAAAPLCRRLPPQPSAEAGARVFHAGHERVSRRLPERLAAASGGLLFVVAKRRAIPAVSLGVPAGISFRQARNPSLLLTVARRGSSIRWPYHVCDGVALDSTALALAA